MICLMESAPALGRCCDVVILNHGDNSVIIHLSFLPQYFTPFDVSELAGIFLLLKNVPDYWFGHT